MFRQTQRLLINKNDLTLQLYTIRLHFDNFLNNKNLKTKNSIRFHETFAIVFRKNA